MGLREEIQSEVAAAFDEDLADAVSDFSGSYVTHRHWDPVTETGGESTAIYTGRGVLTRYKLGRIDGINILHGDLKPLWYARLRINPLSTILLRFMILYQGSYNDTR